jgi:hypothetical protein
VSLRSVGLNACPIVSSTLMSHLPLTKPTYFSIELCISPVHVPNTPPNAHRHASVLHVPYRRLRSPFLFHRRLYLQLRSCLRQRQRQRQRIPSSCSRLCPRQDGQRHESEGCAEHEVDPRSAEEWMDEGSGIQTRRGDSDEPSAQASTGMSQGIADEPDGDLDSSTNPQRRRGRLPPLLGACIPTPPIHSHPLYCSILHPYRQPHRW